MEQPWQPTTFRRYIKAVGGSTRPVRILTDAGEAYIKAINNPIGPHALAREWVATNLARWFGLPTFDCAILTVTEDDEIPLYDNVTAAPGPAFATRALPGDKWGEQLSQLKRLDNSEDLGRLVVFDTWVLNEDRYPPSGSKRRPHPDNVFLTGEGARRGRFRLIAMDFSEAFTSTARELSPTLRHLDRIRDARLHGLFPEFKRLLRPDHLAEPVDRLRKLDRPTLWGIVSGLPRQWEVSRDTQTAIVELLEARARFLADTIIDRFYEVCWPDRLPLK